VSIFQSIQWATIFEKQLAAFPNYSAQQLIKAKNLTDAHIDRVNQEVYNRIDGKILSFSKSEKQEYWPKFLAFLVCLGWEEDAFLFKELFEIKMTPEEKENNKRRDMILKGVENDIQNDKNGEGLLVALKVAGGITAVILCVIYWEYAVGLAGILCVLGVFIGLLSFIMPNAGSLLRVFFFWRIFK
jgi:hypothetical protein